MHNCWIRTSNLVHTFSSHYHYAASVDTSVLQMSVTRFIFNRPCSPRAHSRHLTAGVGHTVRDQPQRPRRPWHRRPGPPLGSPGPGRSVPVTGTVALAPRQLWSDWLKPGWETFAGSCWPVDRSKCSELEHIARGSLRAGNSAGNWNFHNLKFHRGHECLLHGPCEFWVRLPDS